MLFLLKLEDMQSQLLDSLDMTSIMTRVESRTVLMIPNVVARFLQELIVRIEADLLL